MHRRLAWVGLVALGFLTGACSKNECRASLGGAAPETPCQNSVTADDGGGVVEPQCYQQPEMCHGKGIFLFCERVVLSSTRDSVELQNVGQQTLTIKSIKMRGDNACAFVEPAISVPFKTTPDGGVPLAVEPQETAIFSFRFVPPAEGHFSALLEIESNAENWPVLRIPLCGAGVSDSAGENPVQDGGVQVCVMSQCDDVSSAAYSNCWSGWGVGQ